MGQRTQHGYLFMLNLLLTPLLMVIGLIMAMVVMKVVGSLFAILFPLAIMDVQASSMTGLLSIIGFVIIFCTTCVMIVTNCCDLIHHIPDTALTWIGGQNAQALGKKMSDNFATATGALGAVMNQMGGADKMGGKAFSNLRNIKREKQKHQDLVNKAEGGGGGKGPTHPT